MATEIKINSLSEKVDFDEDQLNFLSKCCCVMLDGKGHATGAVLSIESNLDLGESLKDGASLSWVSPTNTNGFKENKKLVEHGATTLSFFLSNELTPYKIVEEARIGTGIDYWLGYDESHEKYDEFQLFQARLEISGIETETSTNTVAQRVKDKLKQTDPSDDTGLPAFVSVIEFTAPKAYFGKK